MSAPVESQFEDYRCALAAVLGHADRHQPAKLYLKGLLLPGGVRDSANVWWGKYQPAKIPEWPGRGTPTPADSP